MTSSVRRGTLALALHDQVTPSFPSSFASASTRGRLSVSVSSSKKNSFTFGKASFAHLDRKSTRLNSSHVAISYAVFCLKKKKKRNTSRKNSENSSEHIILWRHI